MPPSATVGEIVPIKLTLDVKPGFGDFNPHVSNFIMAVLMPKGWKGRQNMTATYGGGKGEGNMVFMPAGTICPNSNGLTWEVALREKFGLAGNLIDDLEWVVMQTDVGIKYISNEEITANIDVKLKVAADDNPTMVKLSFVVANSSDGLTENPSTTDAGYGVTAQYYNQFTTSCFSVTGGSGDMVDFCNPQLTTIDPPKSLDNDIVTIAYNDNLTNTALKGSQVVYLCATGTTSDGKTITVCEQTDKTRMVQSPAGSGFYKLTFWPKKFFSAADGQTIASMTYFVTNADGSIKVGYGNSAAPFTFRFRCP
ncbi:hypothetical protein GCM10028827_29620 [Mucilaginibacter myungsuensis]